MRKFVVMYHFHEIQETKDGEYICEYKKDLPHAKEIVKCAVDDWNKMVKSFIPCLYTGFDDDIASVRAYPSRTDTDAMCIEVRLKPRIRMTEKKRTAIEEAIDAQLSDGWGEGFFGRMFEDKETGSCYYAD